MLIKFISHRLVGPEAAFRDREAADAVDLLAEIDAGADLAEALRILLREADEARETVGEGLEFLLVFAGVDVVAVEVRRHVELDLVEDPHFRRAVALDRRHRLVEERVDLVEDLAGERGAGEVLVPAPDAEVAVAAEVVGGVLVVAGEFIDQERDL